jgi:tetratricopeptide (TPR) repeat protein
LRGRWHYLRDDFQAALPILQEVSQGEKSSQQQASDVLQAYLALGDIYARQDQMDQATAAFENAVAVAPQNPQPHLAAAKAWEKLGRLDLAEKHLRQALELQKDSAEANLQLTQLLLRREMQNPEKQRNWAEFDKALQDLNKAKIESDSPLSWQLDLLRTRADYARRESADSVAARTELLARLKELETKYPKVSALQESLITTYEALQAPEEADRMLAEYAKLEPKKAAPLRASLAASRRKFDVAQSILEEGIKHAPPAEKASLIRQLIGLDLAQDRIKEAGERLQTPT